MKKVLSSMKWLSVIIAACCFITVCLTGCSSPSSKAAPFQIAFCSLYINDNAVSEYAASLQNSMPELRIDGNAPLCTPMIMGEVQNDIEAGVINDPMMAMGGMIKLAALVATGEIDVVIADLDNAARDARGDMYLPLVEVFTEQELSALSDRLLSFDLVETDGYETIPTGERTPICGINITGNEAMTPIFGNQEIGVFIVANTKNLGLAKSVMLSLVH